MAARVNTIDHEGFRYHLFPDHLDWAFHPIARSPQVPLVPIQREVNYDFARNPFDHLLISVTNRCNIVCDYCFRGFDMKKTRELDFERFCEIADHFKKNARHKPTFQFTGGEVFVKTGIEKWFEYLYERDFRIWMTTNGVSSTIRHSTIRRIFANNPKVHVRVSCDGHNAGLYERHRGKPGTFKQVEDNLKYLVDIGQRPSIKTVVTPEVFPFLEDILEWAYDIGLRGWNFNVMRYTGAMAEQPPTNSTAVRREDIPYVGYVQIGRKLVDIVLRKPYLAPLLSISRFGKILDTLYSTAPHGVRMMYYVLNYDGTVYTNDNLYRPEYAVGNVFTDGIAAFRGLEHCYDRLDRDLPACTRCSIHRFCFQKGDFGELYNLDPTLQAEFPNCPDIRQHFIEMLALRNRGAEVCQLVFPPPSDRWPEWR
jgi:radical SAM protein with 4Fe4S-binding SPASM domain